jgi:hypothetical protein
MVTPGLGEPILSKDELVPDPPVLFVTALPPPPTTIFNILPEVTE